LTLQSALFKCVLKRVKKHSRASVLPQSALNYLLTLAYIICNFKKHWGFEVHHKCTFITFIILLFTKRKHLH